MHLVEVILVMLLAVVASSYLVRALPFSVPLPLAQIALGVLIATMSNSMVELDSEIFLFVFLPPLLFLDGWRIPKASLLHDRIVVSSLALGLVIFTVVGVGFLIHGLVPDMPLPVAFALAAVVSPTDPVAVSSIVSRCPMPKRMMHILEGESLLNDASGLVCFRFAVVAAVTGIFSLQTASLTFLWMALGGALIGVAVTLGISFAQRKMSRLWGEESGAAILINLLTPFGAYLAAETFHASGIISAVAAGITMSYIELSGRAPAATRVQRTAVWDMVRFALNGLMFVLLGEQLPVIVSRAMKAAGEAGEYMAGSSVWLVVCAFVITASLIGLRYVWIWVSLRLILFRARLSGNEPEEIDSRIVPVMSLAGVRGAVTLAGVLSLPMVMKHDGSPFPARDQVIFLAAMVILISLVAASILLPWLLRGPVMKVPDASVDDRREDEAIHAAAVAAIKAVEEASHKMAENDPNAGEAGFYTQAALRVIESYRYRLDDKLYAVDDGQTLRNADRVELELRRVALNAERDTIKRLAQSRHISDDVFRQLIDRIDSLLVAQHPETPHH